MPRIPENEAEYQILLGQIEKLMEKDEATLSLEETRLLSLPREPGPGLISVDGVGFKTGGAISSGAAGIVSGSNQGRLFRCFDKLRL